APTATNVGSFGYPLALGLPDASGPTIEIVTPEEGAKFPADTTQVIRGIVHAGGAPIASVTVTGVPVDALDELGNFYARVPVGLGDNQYTFTALDARDQADSETRTLTGVTADDPSTRLTDVTPSLAVEYHRTSLDMAADVLYADLTVQNTGQYPIDAPLRVVISNLNDPTVAPSHPDGFT